MAFCSSGPILSMLFMHKAYLPLIAHRKKIRKTNIYFSVRKNKNLDKLSPTFLLLSLFLLRQDTKLKQLKDQGHQNSL